jgi:hypothetical protein
MERSSVQEETRAHTDIKMIGAHMQVEKIED